VAPPGNQAVNGENKHQPVYRKKPVYSTQISKKDVGKKNAMSTEGERGVIRRMNPNANTDQILIDKREDLTTMKRRLYALFLGFGLAMAICSLPQRVQAALGGSVDSILSDRKALASVHHATIVRNGYTVQEIDNGTTVVREYISPSGIIFGIAWNGLTSMPGAGTTKDENEVVAIKGESR
jgi:hypothetical protein